MKKAIEFLNANPVQYLATVGRDGKAKCRPFMFAGEQTADNPIFEVFYLENAHGLIADFSGNPPYEF